MDINTLRNFAIIFIYVALFGTAAWDKLKSFTTPEWFIKQFEPTFIAKMPGGAKAGYWMIAFFEATLTLAFLASAVYTDLLQYALCGALYLFGMLLIGLRVTYDFQGSANMFTYFAATLLSLYLTNL